MIVVTLGVSLVEISSCIVMPKMKAFILKKKLVFFYCFKIVIKEKKSTFKYFDSIG